MRYRAPLIGLTVIVLASVLFFFLLWQPRQRDLEEVREETARLETERTSLENELRRLEEIQEREVEFRAALARLEEFIPTGVAQATAVRQFQEVADDAGVTIATVSFATPTPLEEAPPTGTPGTELARIGVSMTLEGGYFQAVDFLRRLEVDVPRAALVQDLSMAEGPEGFPELTATWSGELFAVVAIPEVEDPEEEPDPEDLEEPDADADTDDDVDIDGIDDGDVEEAS